MTDQQKATSLGTYGNPDVRTPAFDSLAGDGLRYNWAFTPHPLCVPARTSFWTGRYPHQHGSRSNEILMHEGQEHAARVLKEAGYRNALIGKNHCFRPADLQYFDHTYFAGHTGPQGAEDGPGVPEARAFYRSRDFRSRHAAHAIDFPREKCAAWLIGDHVIELLEAQAAGRITEPLCIWMSIPDPHPPYAAPEPYASSFDPAALTLPPWREGELDDKPQRQRFFHRLSRFHEATEDDIRRALAMYYAQVVFADDVLGRVLSTLQRLGQRERTIVAFTADHGDYAGEHAMMTKSSTMYDCMVRVPLAVSWPGTLPGGQVREELVSTMDVIPTLLRLAGVDAPPALTPDAREARALPGTDTGTLPPREAVYSEYGAGGPYISDLAAESVEIQPAAGLPRLPYLRARECEGRLKMVRTHRWKLVYDPGDLAVPGRGQNLELYDLENDPWELTNLAASSEHTAVLNEMKGRLLDWSLSSEDTRPIPLYYDFQTFEHTQEPAFFGTPR